MENELEGQEPIKELLVQTMRDGKLLISDEAEGNHHEWIETDRMVDLQRNR